MDINFLRNIEKLFKGENILIPLLGVWVYFWLYASFQESLYKSFVIEIGSIFQGKANLEDYLVYIAILSSVHFLSCLIVCYISKGRYKFFGFINIILCNLFGFAVLIIQKIYAKEIFPFWVVVVSLSGSILGYIFYHFYIVGKNKQKIIQWGSEWEFYFSPNWQSFFTIILFSGAFSIILLNLSSILLLIKWMLIGPIYGIFHPNMFGFSLFSDFGVDLSVFFLFFLIPILMFDYIDKVSVSKKTLFVKFLLILLILTVSKFGSLIVRGVANESLYKQISVFVSKGNKIWPVMLNAETRILEKEFRYEYLLKNNNSIDNKEDLRTNIISDYKYLIKFYISHRQFSRSKIYAKKLILFSKFDFEVMNQLSEIFVSYKQKEYGGLFFRKLLKSYPNEQSIIVVIDKYFAKTEKK